MSEQDIIKLGGDIADLSRDMKATQARLAALEAKASKAPERAGAETKRLRALAIQLNQRLGGEKSTTARKLQRRRWVREFAAAALPTAMLQASHQDEARKIAANIAYDLWLDTQRMLAELDAENEREESQETE